LGDNIIFIGNMTGVVEQKLDSIRIKDRPVKSAKKGTKPTIKTDQLVRINDKIFLIRKNTF